MIENIKITTIDTTADVIHTTTTMMMMYYIIFKGERDDVRDREPKWNKTDRRDFLFPFCSLCLLCTYSQYCAVLTTVHRTKDESWPCFHQSDSFFFPMNQTTTPTTARGPYVMCTGCCCCCCVIALYN